MEPPTAKPTAFFLFRDAPLRREALGLPPGAAERYSLYGLDEVSAAGFEVGHNLEDGGRPGPAARTAGAALHRGVRLAGGYPGDFASVLASRSRLNRADVVFSTVDTLGIPLALVARAGLVRPPIVYAAIGLPERLEQLRTRSLRRLYRGAYRRLHTVVAYGAGEVDALRAWLGPGGPEVVFVPFGVDTGYFSPDPARAADADVVSIGSDLRRDYGLLLELARRRPDWSFLVVASPDHSQTLARVPANVRVELELSLADVRDRLRAARVVALPVRDNTYSGATTVLLQAMATAKPVVVSRTAAIARGYELEDGSNCLLVPPGDLAALERGVAHVLESEERALELGARARATVERHLTWRHYADTVRALLLSATGRTTVSA